jgi:DNA-binding transcriptional LysR family regulator
MGEQLAASAEIMADQANTIECHVMADSQELSGRLRVTVADVCTRKLVLPAIRRFTKLYPDVDIELIATRNLLDLAAREADVALRSTDEPPPDLVGKRIAQLGYAIYGSHDILVRAQEETGNGGIPCITWMGDGQSRPVWIEKSFPKTRRVYRTSELGLMLEIVRKGVGMAQMPCVLVEPDPLLHRIPARYVEPGWGIWVLSHVDLRTTARVRIFRDILVEELEKQKARIEGREL